MKKLALVSGLLFVVVYLVVNNITSNDNSFDVIYPSVPAQSLTGSDSQHDGARQGDYSAATDKNSVFFLVIASFNDHELARKTADDFSARYNADFIVLPPASNGFYRISYGKYSSLREAQDALESVKRNGFPDAWISLQNSPLVILSAAGQNKLHNRNRQPKTR